MANQYSPPPLKQSHLPGEMYLPPAKKPRLSPTPGQHTMPLPSSPYGHSPNAGSPTVNYLSLPDRNPALSFHAPQPVQPPRADATPRYTPGIMGPPERPAEKAKEQADNKAVDVNDLSDIITASGINLREEEDYLTALYRNRQNELTQSASFGTTSSSTVSPDSSFRQWSQGSFGAQPAFHGAGPLSQPAVSQKTVEQQMEEKHKQEARKLAENRSKHLQTPFLNLGDLRQRIGLKSYHNQVKFSADGRTQVSDQPKFYGTVMKGAEGIGLVMAKEHSRVQFGSQLDDILSLLSLATQQRLRDVVEDAVEVARSRRHGSHGAVPPDWASIATGNGTPENIMAKPQSLTGTSWDQPPDSAVSPMTGDAGLKQELHLPTPTSPRLPTPPSSEGAPRPTVAYDSDLPATMRELGSAEREAEQKRLAARRKRQEKERQASMDATMSPATPGGPGTPDTPATAASAGSEAKMTKKEREKQAKQVHQTDEVMRIQANATAAMALGGRKKYSWLTSASSATPNTGFGTGVGRLAASRTASGVGKTPAQKEEDTHLRSKEAYKTLGNFREDGPGGKGVQVRDVVTVLEREDSIECRSLMKAYTKMRSEK